MQKQHKLSYCWLLSALFALSACSEDITDIKSTNVSKAINLTGQIQQENVTRANDYGFVSGDRMGIYVVDYQNGQTGTLGASDNRAQNVLFTYDAESYRWSSPTTLYWRDDQTPIDVYGYYPGVNYISNPLAYKFEVQTDQSTEAQNGDLAGYEQSDLLWGKAARVEPTAEQITVKYNHILAGVRVHLIKGEGMTDAEWDKLEKIVLVDNTTRAAEVNLATGVVASVASEESLRSIRMAPQSDDYYRAVIIPQTVAAGKTLISITLDGQTYSHTLSTAMVYSAGKLHDFTLNINKRAASGDYEMALTYDGISPWMNDEGSHNFTATAYVTVNCDEAGKLKECITKAGYDYKTVKNLKVTGTITTEDFYFFRREMPELAHLNLKEVKVVHASVAYDWDHDIETFCDDALPSDAFNGNKTIRSIVLPNNLKRIGGQAFSGMQLMFSTLEIPDGVTYIGIGAFGYNDANGVELILPNTIDSIMSSAFYHCQYSCELKLNDNIKYIGGYAFDETSNFYGAFHIPSGLQAIPVGAFSRLGGNGSFTGEIEIPQGITEISDQAFLAVALKNRVAVTVPNGVKKIGGDAFNGVRFSALQFNNDLMRIDYKAFQFASIPFPIELPNSLLSIGDGCFSNCGIEGELVIPEKCTIIGAGAFSGNYFTKITLPSRLEYINREAFRSNPLLTSITIPKYVGFIDEFAFEGDHALQTVICLNPEPPTLENGVFDGVYFDKCILEVPEASVAAYRNADGWKQFKNITAYHELAFNIPDIVTLDKGNTLSGIIRAEGAWEVAECPDWVTVTPSSGTADERKAELTVTVKPNSGDTREGQIVFRLKDKNYTTYTTVKQVACEYKEDEEIVLQTASAGAPREIPIFIVGDGYNAEDIASGAYLNDMREQMEHLFSIEPYKTYRNYFTVSTAIAVSPERGIGGLTRFNTECYSGSFDSDYDAVWQYALTHGKGVSSDREGQTTIMVLLNTNLLTNTTQLRDNGRSISLMGKSTDSYPYTQREFVLREIGGVAFGKLGIESVNHFTFLKSCTCPGCAALDKYQHAKDLGWYENISISGKMNEVPWSHLIFDSRYSQYVDVYEGAYNHARGTYRSENQSIMGDIFIPYFNTISRQSIVRRILEYSGEGYTFEKFVANDKREYPE